MFGSNKTVYCRRITIGWFVLLSIVALSPETAAQILLPSFISDNMVIQRNDTLLLEGMASKKKAKVRVTCSWGANAAGTTGTDGKFSLRIPTPEAGGPFWIEIAQGREKPVRIDNIMSGEVWFCSGQSNMEMPVGKWNWGTLWDQEKELQTADHPGIRLLQVPREVSDTLVDPVKFKSDGWKICSPASVAHFSALAYFYARILNETLGIAVGVINSSWGGTYIEGWTRREALVPGTEQGLHNNGLYNTVSAFYNSMVYPLQSFPIRGAIWYQGEQNESRHTTYNASLEALITDWRTSWGNEFPFYIVQLAGYHTPQEVQPGSNWAALRQAQAETLHLPATGMVTAIDLGDPADIHPPRKKEVAERLANLALAETYGIPRHWRAPYPLRTEVAGNKMIVEFSEDVCPDLLPVTGFILEDDHGNFYKADAVMTGYREIELSADSISTPTGARYNWADYPTGNLRGANGLPVLPFRTDRLIEYLKNGKR